MAIGMPHHKELALQLRDKYGIGAFVETGTYKGDTTRWAAGEFARVVTIEGHKPRYTKTRAALKELDNVRCVFGDSRVKLAAELDKINEPAILWLDAHWCGNYELSAGTPGECPLIEELDAVRTDDIVLIDDARLFLAPPPMPHDAEQWPTIDQIRAKLRGRYTTVHADVIISVPLHMAQTVRDYTGQSDAPQFVVATSNKYVGMLPAFAYLFNKHLSADVPCRVVRYDVRHPKLPPNFQQYAIGYQSDYSFTAGLLKFVNWYSNDLMILMLEDYWLTAANYGYIVNLWQYMAANPEIVKFDLTGDRAKFPHTQFDKGYLLSADDAPFRASLQAAIWRTDYLREKLAAGDWTPWQFEKHAAQNDKEVILGVPPGEIAMSYVNACGGEGRKPGEYDMKKIPIWLWQELQKAKVV